MPRSHPEPPGPRLAGGAALARSGGCARPRVLRPLRDESRARGRRRFSYRAPRADDRLARALAARLRTLYLTLHLAGTGTYLFWLHRRRPAAFPLVRTTLLIASALALIGYVAF